MVFGGEKLELGIFKNCIGEQIAFKEKVGRHVGRNPLIKEISIMDGFLSLIIKIYLIVSLDSFRGKLFLN